SAQYARSMVAGSDDWLRWFPNASLFILEGNVQQIGMETIAAKADLSWESLFPNKEARRFGLGLYNPSLAAAEGGLLAVFRASNWQYCPHSGWDGNWSHVPHHKVQAQQYNRPMVALLTEDLQVLEAAAVDFPKPRFSARFQEVQGGQVLAERAIEGPEDLRVYRAEDEYWISFSFRTAFLARLGLRLCRGAAGCRTAAWIDEESVLELTPQALTRKEHRQQQAFKNLNIARLSQGAALVEFSVNPRVLLQVDLVSGLWLEVASSETPSMPLLPSSQYFYRGGFCCVPLDWRGSQVSLGVAHIKFNRYVFLHRFYVASEKPPYEVLAISPELCFHFLGAGQAWQSSLGPGCETLQFVSGMVLLPQDTSGTLLLSVGVSDCESSFVSLELEVVLALLSPVPSRRHSQGVEVTAMPEVPPTTRPARALALLLDARAAATSRYKKAIQRLEALWTKRLAVPEGR
ncbi:unnamed protein product, partial [Effrenium voratum]